MYYANWDWGKVRQRNAAWLEGKSVSEREALMFRRVMELYPIHIEAEDRIAGWYGFESQQALEEALYPPAEEAALESAAEPVSECRRWMDLQGCHVNGYDRMHHIIDYAAVMAHGIDFYVAKVEAELQNPENTAEKNDYLSGMRIALGAARQLAEAFAAKAEAMAQTAQSQAEKDRLLRMAAACRRVPMQPPRDFYEALQAAWLLRTVCAISSTSGVSVSYGSFDQYMYPYYLISKEAGMTEDEVISLLVQFFRMLDHYDGNDCALSVGGVDENGNDATNELSWLMVKAEKITRLRGPLFVARINKNTPKEFMRELVCKELFEIGQPSFYSEESCLAAVMSRGIDVQEARRYQISTCMCLAMPHGEATHGWGMVFNTHLPLELALTGAPIDGEMPAWIRTPLCEEYDSIEALWAQYTRYTAELLNLNIDRSEELFPAMAKWTCNPWLSALTEDCISRGKDRWNGGALYHDIVVETFALADTADAFTAIQKLVFEEKKYTLEQFMQAAQANYKGFEELHRDILACPKYGMGEPAADENAQRLTRLYADLCEARYAENRRYLPSLHTLSSDISWGAQRPAFFGGRKAGEPIAKNAGPTTAARKAGPTNLVLSAGSLEQRRYSGGQALDVHIGVRNLDSVANRDKIAALIRTYFELGGLQMQVNGLSVDTLKKAYADPASYPDLIVRIGGHSRYFKDFDDTMKRRFIERFEVEEGAFA